MFYCLFVIAMLLFVRKIRLFLSIIGKNARFFILIYEKSLSLHAKSDKK